MIKIKDIVVEGVSESDFQNNMLVRNPKRVYIVSTSDNKFFKVSAKNIEQAVYLFRVSSKQSDVNTPRNAMCPIGENPGPGTPPPPPSSRASNSKSSKNRVVEISKHEADSLRKREKIDIGIRKTAGTNRKRIKKLR